MRAERYQAKPARRRTTALPGTPAKIEIMRERVAAGQSPFHPRDEVLDLRRFPVSLRTFRVRELCDIAREGDCAVRDPIGDT